MSFRRQLWLTEISSNLAEEILNHKLLIKPFCIAGAISSTANDMARWMNMLLSGSLNEAGKVVFDSGVISETRSPENAYSYNPDSLYSPPAYVHSMRIRLKE